MEPVMDIKEIWEILPHRYPFLLVDRVIEHEPRKRAVGYKNCSINEEFFQGHFPGEPVMPGVLQIEAMAQLAGALMLKGVEEDGKLPFLMSIDNVKFRKTVAPGDQLMLEAEATKIGANRGEVKTWARVEGRVVAEAQIRFMLVKRDAEDEGKRGEGKPRVHKTAVVSTSAVLGRGVVVGPYCIVDGGVKIGDNTVLRNNVTITGNTEIGQNNTIYQHAVIGTWPQDLSFEGDDTKVKIGDANVIRESVTIHCGTHKADKITLIGDNNYLMAYSHIAHDCDIGNNVILANGVQLGGHVKIEDRANIGGLAALHHFVTVGRLAFVGGATRVVRDVPPFMIVEGNPAKVRCINVVGCSRSGMRKETITQLKAAHRTLYRSGLPMSDATAELEKNSSTPEIGELVAFIKNSAKGRQGRAREAQRRQAEESVEQLG